jgi:hypothetical protein
MLGCVFDMQSTTKKKTIDDCLSKFHYQTSDTIERKK